MQDLTLLVFHRKPNGFLGLASAQCLLFYNVGLSDDSSKFGRFLLWYVLMSFQRSINLFHPYDPHQRIPSKDRCFSDRLIVMFASYFLPLPNPFLIRISTAPNAHRLCKSYNLSCHSCCSFYHSLCRTFFVVNFSVGVPDFTFSVDILTSFVPKGLL